MNSDTLILRSTTNPPLTNKNDYLTPTDFDGNFIKIYDDLLSLCVTTGVIAYNASTTYDDEVVQYATYGGRLWSWVNASPGSAITPGTNALYWAEIFPSQLAHRMNSDTILSEGTADEVTAAEIRAFIDGGLTTTTNLAVTEQTNNSLKITSSTGTDAVLTEATISLAGLLSADDKSRLINTNGVNTGDQTLDSLGAEAVANKATDFTTINDTLYPSVAAVSAEITSQIATATAPESTIYKVLLNQTGIGAPVITVGKNTLTGTPAPSYIGVGSYELTLASEFAATKTHVSIQSNSDSALCFAERKDDNTIKIITTDGSLARSNGILSNTSLFIEVFP